MAHFLAPEFRSRDDGEHGNVEFIEFMEQVVMAPTKPAELDLTPSRRLAASGHT